MLELEVLEVKRSHLLDLGITWPARSRSRRCHRQRPRRPTAPPRAISPCVICANLNSNNIGVTIDPTTVQARQQITDSNLLANPRNRARNREKAKILIGDRLPTITFDLDRTGFVARRSPTSMPA